MRAGVKRFHRGLVCGGLAVAWLGWASITNGQCVGMELAKLTAADGASDDQFGMAVSVSGDLVVIGSLEDDDNGSRSGSAYLYRANPSLPNVWNQEAKLLASDGATQDQFGWSVSASADVVVVGAPGHQGSRGAAYVFRQHPAQSGVWQQEAKLVATDRSAGDLFGAAVAVSGDLIAVGAYGDDILAGAAYVFRAAAGSPGGWLQEAKLVASDRSPVDLFGISVAADGDVVVAGALEDDDLGNSSGSAYAFRFDGAAWSQQAKLLASDGTNRDQFGWAVGVSGQTIVVGARNHKPSGAAYVFAVDAFAPNGWDEAAKLTPDGAASEALFGESVAVDGDIIAIGATEGVYGQVQSGAAYIYRFDGCLWQGEAMVVSSDGAALDQFGRSVAVSGDLVVVGADLDDDQGGASGSAYVFRGAADCDANDLFDMCDVLSGQAIDADGDGVPDHCQSDTDQDGVSDAIDTCPITPSPGGVDEWGRPIADLDHDCDVDLADFSVFTLNFGAKPTP